MLQKYIICLHEIGGSLGCCSHALVELAVFRNTGQVRSKVRLLNFKKADFQLLREIVSGILRDKEWNRAGKTGTEPGKVICKE